MTLLPRDELQTLIDHRDETCVSLYMPTHRAGDETQQDPIRFDNLLTRAEESLVETGQRPADARTLLEPAQRLLQDYDFWQHQGDGLALFLAPGVFRPYRLPRRFEELVVVGERFHVKPLLPLISRDSDFYVLALSQDEVRLFYGTAHEIHAVELEDVPQGLWEALRYDDPEAHLQFHTSTDTAGTPGARAAKHHGQGVGTDDEQTNILRYFHKIDAGLVPYLRDDQAPLVLAGVDYLLPMYAEANTYPHLLEQGIEGNPEHLSAAELHEKAWVVVRPFLEAERQEALDRYQYAAGAEQDMASADLREILVAALGGRVDILFLKEGEQRWGHFDPGTTEITVQEGRTADATDLFDLAAAYTFGSDGVVYLLSEEDMPDGAKIAALYRY